MRTVELANRLLMYTAEADLDVVSANGEPIIEISRTVMGDGARLRSVIVIEFAEVTEEEQG